MSLRRACAETGRWTGEPEVSLRRTCAETGRWAGELALSCQSTCVGTAEAPDSVSNVGSHTSTMRIDALPPLSSLPPHRQIDPVASSWSLTSVGRALVTLKKAANATWPRLLKVGAPPCLCGSCGRLQLSPPHRRAAKSRRTCTCGGPCARSEQKRSRLCALCAPIPYCVRPPPSALSLYLQV